MNNVGTKIKEMRLEAGMSQAKLAEEAECVTAADISKAERGIQELSDEQLEAVAKVLNMTPESLSSLASAVEDEPVKLSAEEREWLDLYEAADPDRRQLALCILKGTPDSPDFEKAIFAMLKSIEPAQMIGFAKNMILGSNVADLLAFAKNFMSGMNGMGLMSTFSNMSNNSASNGSSTGDASARSVRSRYRKEISVPLLAFTYFYAVTIYILLLSFYFWLWRTDIKPEK